ncbi:serine/arginine-rich splicing factor 6-like isoform X1 [Onthophagus taurus]|uniref:serine/arginine-rich splicing factor 6-like isoform X1 n=2 Tax=Onthophagus taurus TaxID=166361 RepID=UPI0039BDFF66
MESNKGLRPLKRLPQVTLWELRRHTITVRNPLAWDKTGSDKPIQRDIGDLSELCLHRAGEGATPLFERDDILVNQDGMEQRTMRIKRPPGANRRSQSTSSDSSSDSSRSKSSAPRSKGWRAETKPIYPKPLRFTCERKNSPAKEDSYRSPPRRRQSVSPYRRGTKRKTPDKSPQRQEKGSFRTRDRNRSPPRSAKSSERNAGSSHSKSERSRRSKSPLRSRETRRRSRSRDRFKRNSPPSSRRSRSPRRLSRNRHRVRNQTPPPSRYSPHKDQIPPIDYAHLAHVITQMYPRQPFIPPHIVPPVPEFYPPYAIPPGPIPPRPRFPPRPPIIYNNRSIKIFKPNETSTTASSTVTTTVTTASSSSNAAPASSTVTSNEESYSETRTDEIPSGTDK